MMPVSEMLAREPAAIILSGGPSSVYVWPVPRLVDAYLFMPVSRPAFWDA